MLRYSKSLVISATLALVVITLDIGGQEQQPLGLVMANTSNNTFNQTTSGDELLINNQTSSHNTATLIKEGDDSLYNFRYEQAITYYDKALGLDPNNVHALSGRAYALSELNRYEEAISAYDKALTIDPTNVTLLHSKAYLLSYLGEYNEALEVYDRILAIEPDNVDALFNKGFDLG
jgi:tetratricopeptide (TPR) repeat protein